MKIIDEPLLDEFRRKVLCEWCERPAVLVPHHIYARGMGGGGRLDIRENLISLCCICHHFAHMGAIQRLSLLAIAGKRCGKTCEEAKDLIERLLHAKKGIIPREQEGSYEEENRP